MLIDFVRAGFMMSNGRQVTRRQSSSDYSVRMVDWRDRALIPPNILVETLVH